MTPISTQWVPAKLRGMLEKDEENADASHITAVLDSIDEDKACIILWKPTDGHSFEKLRTVKRDDTARIPPAGWAGSVS